MVEDPPLTDLIKRAQDGDRHALKSVFDVTYDELRRLARARLSKGGRGTLLDTSALVHESCLRFANAGQLCIEDRQHFQYSRARRRLQLGLPRTQVMLVATYHFSNPGKDLNNVKATSTCCSNACASSQACSWSIR